LSSWRITPHSSDRCRLEVRHLAGGLELGALVDQERDVAAVVDDLVGALPVAEVERALGAPPVLLERLALPGEDRDAGRLLDRAVGPTATAAARRGPGC
jgi:hypothetical protein